MSDQRRPGTQPEHQQSPGEFSRALEVEGPTVKAEGLPAPWGALASLGAEHTAGPEHQEPFTTSTLGRGLWRQLVYPVPLARPGTVTD